MYKKTTAFWQTLKKDGLCHHKKKVWSVILLLLKIGRFIYRVLNWPDDE